MVQAALLGGLFTGILGALPFIGVGNCCCCLWNLCGGAIAAYLEQQNTGRTTNVARGALAGLASGVIAAVVWLFLTLALGAVLGSGLALQQAAVDREMPPEVREAFEMVASGGPGLIYGSFFFLMLFIGSAMSAAGGALAATFFRNDVPPALGGPIQPPPLSQ